MFEHHLLPPISRDISGHAIHQHIRALFPILRSITGKGIVETLQYISAQIKNFSTTSVASGDLVFDWTVPKEWNVSSAKLMDKHKNIIIDINDSTLHILQYSLPFNGLVSREELEEHLFTLPNQPDLIPYKTSYYTENWGFCLSENQKRKLTDTHYYVDIDATLTPGFLKYGEVLIPGELDEEFLFSIHCCHPSLANDNLSSLAIAIELIRKLQDLPERRLSYRFLFLPGTIGSITWLARNSDKTKNIKNGLVLSCLGDNEPFTYKKAREDSASINALMGKLLSRQSNARIWDFEPYGYDERQYCSPGFNLPVGCLMRSPNGTFPEYHTSADNLDFVTPDALETSFSLLADLITITENSLYPVSTSPYGEPQLGKRGLYPLQHEALKTDEIKDDLPDQLGLLWVLNLSDGKNSILDIASRSQRSFRSILYAVDILQKADLLKLYGRKQAQPFPTS